LKKLIIFARAGLKLIVDFQLSVLKLALIDHCLSLMPTPTRKYPVNEETDNLVLLVQRRNPNVIFNFLVEDVCKSELKTNVQDPSLEALQWLIGGFQRPICAPCKLDKRKCDRNVPCERCTRLEQEEKCIPFTLETKTTFSNVFW
jgi:hypothetical protein